MILEPMTLHQFDATASNHDWFFEHVDSFESYRYKKGALTAQMLDQDAEGNTNKLKLLAFHNPFDKGNYNKPVQLELFN